MKMIILGLLISVQSFAASNYSRINSFTTSLPDSLLAQSFVADASGTVKVSFDMQQEICDSDPCTGSIIMQLYSNSGDHPGTAMGSPVSQALSTMNQFYDPLDPFDTENPPIVEFDFGVSVEQGQKYYIVITHDSNYVSDEEYVDIAYDSYYLDSPTPSEEPAQYFSGGVWQTPTGNSRGLVLTDVEIN